MSRKLIFRGIIVLVVLGAFYRMYQGQPEFTLSHLTGTTMGSIQYNVKYLGVDEPNYQMEVDSILQAFNQSLSTYVKDSEISRLNRIGKLANPSKYMKDVLEESEAVYSTTDGAFDPTVGPLVNLWGFGPDKRPQLPDSLLVDSIRALIGFHRIVIAGNLVQMDSSMYLDFSAIAKGYAVDLIGEFLEARGYANYMVEIGGEVRAKGRNEKNEIWKIGIEDPLVQLTERRLLAIVELNDLSMATSGNYRNYYEREGRIIAHTIDPRTGYSTSHSLLSASVFARNCMTADAYATAFMVLGLEGSKTLLEASDLMAFLVYLDDQGEMQTYVSAELDNAVQMERTQQED